MYNLRSNDDLAINSKLLLNADKESLEKVFMQNDVHPNSLEDMLRSIHDWYKKEPHLPEGQLHDQFIARLLMLRKFSIENVKQKIDNYYTVRPKMTEFLGNRDPMDPNLNAYLKYGHWIILPKGTPDNCRVTMFRIKSSEGISALDIVKVICMMIDYRMWNDSIMAEHLVLNYENVTLQLALQMTPVLISKIIYYITECVGAKIKGIHILNMPSYAEIILNLFKNVMKPKLVKRMHVYKSFDDVLKIIPESVFPKDLGGSYDITSREITDAWERTLCSPPWRKYFKDQDSIRTDESKRIIRKNFHDNFGLDGTFTKLNID